MIDANKNCTLCFSVPGISKPKKRGEAQANEADAPLEALLIDGLSKGEQIPLSPEFWSELKQDATKILARRK